MVLLDYYGRSAPGDGLLEEVVAINLKPGDGDKETALDDGA